MTDNTQQFWEDRWREAVKNSPMRRRRLQGNDPMQRWNKMAGDFAERTSEKESGDKRQKILDWLCETGALRAGAKILDIGAGPGNWALPLARQGAMVTALEPAGAMIKILEDRARDAEIAGIEMHQATWQEIDLDGLGWRGAFDLVFASMTPGVDGPEMLEKMIAASRGFCYLAAFAGKHWQAWYGGLWRKLFNEELSGHVNDIIHPFNLVYAMGYRPELRFESWERQISWPHDKAMEDFTTHMESYTEITAEVYRTIAAHVDEHSRDGLFCDTRSGCRGMMLWDVRQRQIDNQEGREV